jgi:hypothetical protein
MSDFGIEELYNRYNKTNEFPPFCRKKLWDSVPTDSIDLQMWHDVTEWSEDRDGNFPCNTNGCDLRVEGDPMFPAKAKITGSCCLAKTVEVQLPKAA